MTGQDVFFNCLEDSAMTRCSLNSAALLVAVLLSGTAVIGCQKGSKVESVSLRAVLSNGTNAQMAQLEDVPFTRFDGKYPPMWPKELALPPDAFVQGAAIKNITRSNGQSGYSITLITREATDAASDRIRRFEIAHQLTSSVIPNYKLFDRLNQSVYSLYDSTGRSNVFLKYIVLDGDALKDGYKIEIIHYYP
jgi:hypothetical protein